ncbi:MAG: TonB-dependent receptor [Gammaproteobacteria bacterium]|nr:TonB-dependent receptor [Gammaproteobacteria bacterium]
MLTNQFRVFTAITLYLIAIPAISQDTSLEQDTSIKPILINATRVEKDPVEIPAAISTIGQDKIQLGTEQLGLDESLTEVPGLFMRNRYNFAQDLRVSIRGYGARSSFGIRGIKIIVDGIPETLPDGQGSVDGIDIGSASQINVIRGPTSSLYGNAAGGAILIETEKGPVIPFGEVRTTYGDYDFTKLQLKAGGETGNLNYLVNVSDTSTDNYRDHSKYENTQFNGRFEYTPSADSSLITSIHHTDQPVAEDPGGITSEAAADDPTQARERNLLFDAGESLEQTRIGLLYKTALNPGRDLEARIYHTTREFDNRLPFESGGSVSLDRNFNGGGLKYTIESGPEKTRNRLLLGLDYDHQDDDRSRFDNLMGVIGDQTLEQNELVTSVGVFLQNEARLTETTELTAGLRYDEITFDVSDEFLSDGDDSGRVRMDEVSPMLGISFKRSDYTHWYANISQAFETPTTTEFANPSGGGFNQSLEPQESINYEVGIKTRTEGYRFEVALFHIDIENELIPFGLAGQPGRTFYENAGSSSRDGLEIFYGRPLFEQLSFSMAYTYSNFEFDDFTDDNGNNFDGNQTPGVPENILNLGFSWFGKSGIYANWDTLFTGELYADNANDTLVESSSVSHFRVGYNGFYDDWEAAAFLGVNNVFDEDYNDNIRINAFGGRYFEPAPEQNAYVGFTLRRRFKG